MAEAVAAFSLAANVLQFVEFAKKVFDKGLEIHRSGGTVPNDLRDLRNAVANLQAASGQLQISQAERMTLSTRYQQVVKVSDSCTEKCSEILKSLDSIGFRDERTRWGAIVTAFKATWNQKTIDDLKAQVTTLSESLNVALLNSLRDYAMRSAEQQELILQKLGIVQDNTGILSRQFSGGEISWDAPGDAVIDFVTRNLDADAMERQLSAKSLRNGMLRHITGPDKGGEYIAKRSCPVFNIPRVRKEELEAEFLNSFYHPGMDSRRSGIVNAHEKTLRWVFDDNSPQEDGRKWSDLREWLKSDEPLYWVTGKAGSGKSTLMKFISDSGELGNDTLIQGRPSFPNDSKAQCHRYLIQWAKPRPLIIASFYFWASGTAMAASPRGLYMSLIHQILRRCPEVIPQVSPIHWESMCLFNDPIHRLPEDELRKWLNSTMKAAQVDYNICLFVDGLDEFSGAPENLLKVFKDLISLPNVKLCVSSRPWIVFEDDFQHRPSLKLEDLTFRDIKAFVTEQFENDTGFRRLMEREPRYAGNLIEDITKKSSGVFLWVNLVVRSLLTGMGHDDRMSDMKKRLDLLPPDLERLYSAILDTLDPFYFEHAAQYFKILEACDEPPSPVLLSFADEDDRDFALKLPLETYTQQAISSRTETIRRRINSRCKGLLEIASIDSSDDSGTWQIVQYLHRSVKDFVESPAVGAKLRAAAETFDCHIRLCSANLALVKTTSNPRSRIVKYAAHCLEEAALVEKENLSSMITLLNDLQKTTEQKFRNDRLEEFYQMVSGVDNLSPWLEHYYGFSFLSLAVHKGVSEYVKVKATPGCLVLRTDSQTVGRFRESKRSWAKKLITRLTKAADVGATRPDGHLWWPLLLDATFILPPKLDMVACLLQRDAEVNFQFKDEGTTVWDVFMAAMLVCCCMGSRNVEDGWNNWIPIMKLFIDRGASINRRHFSLVMAETERCRWQGINREALYRSLQSLHTDNTDSGLESLRQAATSVAGPAV